MSSIRDLLDSILDIVFHTVNFAHSKDVVFRCYCLFSSFMLNWHPLFHLYHHRFLYCVHYCYAAIHQNRWLVCENLFCNKPDLHSDSVNEVNDQKKTMIMIYPEICYYTYSDEPNLSSTA